MSTITLSSQAKAPNCPAPKPPPPPKPPKLDEARAIEIACQGPAFPPEVMAALRNLLPPVSTGRVSA